MPLAVPYCTNQGVIMSNQNKPRSRINRLRKSTTNRTDKAVSIKIQEHQETMLNQLAEVMSNSEPVEDYIRSYIVNVLDLKNTNSKPQTQMLLVALSLGLERLSHLFLHDEDSTPKSRFTDGRDSLNELLIQAIYSSLKNSDASSEVTKDKADLITLLTLTSHLPSDTNGIRLMLLSTSAALRHRKTDLEMIDEIASTLTKKHDSELISDSDND